MSRKTAEQIYGMTADLLRTDADASGIPGLEETRTLDWINDLNAEYFERWRESGRLPPPYMRKSKSYECRGTTALSSDITSSDVGFSVDDGTVLHDNSANAAAIFGNGTFDVFTYTDRSTNALTGVSELDFDHEEGNTVHALHPLPDDFLDFRVDKTHNGLTVNGFGGYDRVSENPQGCEFAVFEDSDENKYLWLPKQLTTGVVTVFYEVKPSTIDSTDDQIDIRSPHHWFIVWGLLGIFKQILDDSYVPQKEEQMKQRVLMQAMTAGTVGRRLSAGDAYFQRSYDPVDVGFYLPPEE